MPTSPARVAPANQQTVRQHNRALVLGSVAEAPGRTRAQIALDVGLTRATVSTLVDELVAARLLVERAPAVGRRGRPGSPLELDPGGAAVIGVEIDVDRTSACVLDLTGAVRERRTVLADNAAAAPDVTLRRVARLVEELASRTPVSAVALALAALVTDDGVVRRAPNLPRWDGTRPALELAGRLAVPVVSAGNEANLAALAEHWYGSRLSDFVHVSAEIGVGGGVVVGGELFAGVRGFAGELGHVCVDPGGPVCVCGNRGCLEQVAGRRAILRAAGVADEDELVARAERGAPRAERAIEDAARALGVALGAVLNTLDVPHVVLGGCYARLGDRLAEPLSAELARRVVSGAPVEVHVSTLGADGPMLGAAGAVIKQIVRTASRPGEGAA